MAQSKVVLAGVVLLTMGMVSGVRAEPMQDYELQWCGGTYQPCNFPNGIRMPTAQERAGLTQQVFQDYYYQHIPGSVGGTFHWTVVDSSTDGTIIGPSFGGANGVDSEFVYKNGALVCCTTDFPFMLNGVNDNGLVIGYNPYGPDYHTDIIGRVPSTPQTSIQNIARIINLPPLSTLSPRALTYLDIDNQNRVLGRLNPAFYGSNSPHFILQPVPEPQSILLLATVIVGCGLIYRRRTS